NRGSRCDYFERRIRQHSQQAARAAPPLTAMKNAQLIYSIICDDVRIEMGNKLSLMGIFENIFFQAFPSALLKFAIVNHWVGNGQFETHVKILAPDRKELVLSAPSKFVIESNGYADNVTFFTNVS